MSLRIILLLVCVLPQWVFALTTIDVSGEEDGSKTTGQAEIWHDVANSQTIEAVQALYEEGEFKPLQSAGSTGLQPGAFWSHFALRNVTDSDITLHLEYIDHQLIGLDAFERNPAQAADYRPIASMALSNPFEVREVAHNRFVFKVHIPAHQITELMVKFSSHQAGFVFPSMRIWSPDKLSATNIKETSIIMFMFGGIFLMSVISFVGALATQDKTFLAYSAYALSKIIGWCTILGYTHGFLITNNFHQRYMSIGGAMTIFFGVIFARTFLQTRKYTPKIDYVFLFMMCNATFLLVSALFSLTGLAVLSITIALFFYPTMSIAGIVRWRQGSIDAAVFALAWSMLVFGLVVQALRDLGVVEHNMINYYWPAVASFIEMLGIMFAMGIKLRSLRLQKERAEHRYTDQLERSKAELEHLVWERTQALEKAKLEAEQEARIDYLTGIYNRRSFFLEAGKCLHLAIRKQKPLSLLMFDIDLFKSINDTYGHSMGDEALRLFSKTITHNLRDTDVWGRLGGEEFALVLIEDKQGTREIAHRLRKKIAAIKLGSPEGEIRLTASIGVAYLTSEQHIEALITKADEALYRAKHQGRDQIIEYEGF